MTSRPAPRHARRHLQPRDRRNRAEKNTGNPRSLRAELTDAQQLGSSVVRPVVQREMGTVPPAVFMLSVVATGALIGIVGAAFRTADRYDLQRDPRLYVQEKLERRWQLHDA